MIELLDDRQPPDERGRFIRDTRARVVWQVASTSNCMFSVEVPDSESQEFYVREEIWSRTGTVLGDAAFALRQFPRSEMRRVSEVPVGTVLVLPCPLFAGNTPVPRIKLQVELV